MKKKKISIFLRGTGFGTFKIVRMNNAVSFELVDRTRVSLGDTIDNRTAEALCKDRTAEIVSYIFARQ